MGEQSSSIAGPSWKSILPLKAGQSNSERSERATATPSRKRPADSFAQTKEKVTPKRRKGAPYTEKEEWDMARYIVGRLPTATAFVDRDWDDFVKSQEVSVGQNLK